jgi:predicted O-methyltransferase YrrM
MGMNKPHLSKSLPMLQSLKQYVRDHLKYLVLYDFGLLETKKLVKDTLAMQHLAPLSDVYLPWSIYSLKPTDVVRVLNEIVVYQKSCILECGAGISTYYIAKILRDRGGHLYSLEHDQQWANVIQELLEKSHLSPFVSMISVPLREAKFGIDGCFWYDEQLISHQLSGLKFDLLLVDGPPAADTAQMYARYPAVPTLKEFLAEDCTIILDDVDRPGEREIISRWEKLLGIRFKKYLADGRVAIGRSQHGFEI